MVSRVFSVSRGQFRALCWIEPVDTTPLTLPTVHCTFHSQPTLCVCLCVCGPGMWPFPWFHSSAVRMCLSEQEFGIAFLKQTRGKREKRGGTGQRAFSKGLGMVSGLDEGWFLHRWPWNSSFVCWVCVVCVCVSTAVSTGLPDDSSTDGFIGFTLNEGKRRRHLLWFGLTGTP